MKPTQSLPNANAFNLKKTDEAQKVCYSSMPKAIRPKSVDPAHISYCFIYRLNKSERAFWRFHFMQN